MKVSPDLKETLPPSLEEIQIMRSVDPMNIFLGSKSKIESETFEDFYTTLKAAYEASILLL